jgi:hypothetical protein
MRLALRMCGSSRNILAEGWEGGVACTGSMWLRQRQVVGSCKHGNKHLGYIKCRGFLEELRNY